MLVWFGKEKLATTWTDPGRDSEVALGGRQYGNKWPGAINARNGGGSVWLTGMSPSPLLPYLWPWEGVEKEEQEYVFYTCETSS